MSTAGTAVKLKLPDIPWYYVTRALGVALLLFGVFGDGVVGTASHERGTIILTGAGLLGLETVAPKGGDKRDEDDSA